MTKTVYRRPCSVDRTVGDSPANVCSALFHVFCAIYCTWVRVDLWYDMTWVRLDRGYEITWVRVDLVRVDLGYELTVYQIVTFMSEVKSEYQNL